MPILLVFVGFFVNTTALFMASKQRILAIDVGGTNVRAGVVEETNDGLVVLEDTYYAWKTGMIRNPEIVIGRTIEGVRKRFDKKRFGIAWDVAGPVINHAIVPKAQNMKFLQGNVPYPLKDVTEELYRRRTIICNDLEAAIAGEVEHGSLQEVKNGMLVNLGTGYGGSYVRNGVADAAEPGHLPYFGSERTCGCGNIGCVEAEISGGAVKQKIIEYCADKSIKIPKGMHPCAFADQQANDGVGWAVDLYTTIARDLGRIFGGELNRAPQMTHISYMGSFILKAMQLEFFRYQVHDALIRTSQFKEQHKNVVVAPVSAPMYKGQPLAPLLGSARIWLNTFGA